MLANHIDLTIDHCADTRIALARETRRTERSKEAGMALGSPKHSLCEQTLPNWRMRPHPRFPVFIFCRYERRFLLWRARLAVAAPRSPVTQGA